MLEWSGRSRSVTPTDTKVRAPKARAVRGDGPEAPIALVAQGETTLEEVLRVTQERYDASAKV